MNQLAMLNCNLHISDLTLGWEQKMMRGEKTKGSDADAHSETYENGTKRAVKNSTVLMQQSDQHQRR